MIRLLPPANEVWGKVMFLHKTIILFIGEAGLYDVISCLAAWSHVPSRGLCLWSHVPPRGVSVSGSMFLPGGLCLGVSLTEIPLHTDCPRQRPPGQRHSNTETPPWTETPPGLTPPLYCKERILPECILALHLVPHARIIYISKIKFCSLLTAPKHLYQCQEFFS